MTPQLGVWIRGLTVHPVKINDIVPKADGDIEYVSDCPHCLPLEVVLDNPLSQVGRICSNHGVNETR